MVSSGEAGHPGKESSIPNRCDLNAEVGGRKGRGAFLVAFQPCRPFQRDLLGCLRAGFLSLLTQGFCVCCSSCLSGYPSLETSNAPFNSQFTHDSLRDTFLVLLIASIPPIYAIVASFSLWYLSCRNVIFTYVFL